MLKSTIGNIYIFFKNWSNYQIEFSFEFPDELNLDEFVDEGGVHEDYTYLLHAVLVHSGDFHGGHYVVFINTNLKGSHRVSFYFLLLM